MTRRGFLISILAVVAALATAVSAAQGSAKRSYSRDSQRRR